MSNESFILTYIRSKNLISIPEVNDFLVLICSSDHPLAKKDIVKLEELKNERFIMREQGSGTRELFERYMLDNNIPIKIVFEANSSETIKKTIMESQCLAVLSIRLVEDEVKKGKIHVIKNMDCDWDRDFSLVYHKDKFVTEEINYLIELVKKYKCVDILEGIKIGSLVK